MKKSVLDQLLTESGVSAPAEKMTVNTLIKEGMLLALVEDLGPDRCAALLSEADVSGAIGGVIGKFSPKAGEFFTKTGHAAGQAVSNAAGHVAAWAQGVAGAFNALPGWQKAGITAGAIVAAAGTAAGAYALVKRLKAAKSKEEVAKIGATIKAKAAANKAKK